jgi:hypothetical protein
VCLARWANAKDDAGREMRETRCSRRCETLSPLLGLKRYVFANSTRGLTGHRDSFRIRRQPGVYAGGPKLLLSERKDLTASHRKHGNFVCRPNANCLPRSQRLIRQLRFTRDAAGSIDNPALTSTAVIRGDTARGWSGRSFCTASGLRARPCDQIRRRRGQKQAARAHFAGTAGAADGAGLRSHSPIQSRNVSYHITVFCGFKIQCPSSG